MGKKAMLFRRCFSRRWGKKSNIVPVHKNNCRNLLKNYWPISLLPMLSKGLYLVPCLITLWKIKCLQNVSLLLYPGIHVLLNDYQLLMRSTNVLTSTHRLKLRQAFDKVSHEGLIFKLQSYGIGGNLLRLLEND